MDQEEATLFTAQVYERKAAHMTYNLEYYKVFYYVAKAGNLTMAARQLSISQPAVSQSLKQLESLIGAKLFVRTSKGVKYDTIC